MRTLTWEDIEFGNLISIAAIHYRNQPIENSMSSSPLGCDFVPSLLFFACINPPVYFVKLQPGCFNMHIKSSASDLASNLKTKLGAM